MAKTSLAEFRPDWVSAPGDTMADIMAERDLSVAELAGAIDNTVEQAQRLVHGKERISNKIAERLANVFETSVEFWLARESQYREDLYRLKHPSVAHTKAAWLKELPLGDMIKFGWLPPVNSISEKIDECLRFFDVPDETVWRQKYSNRIQGPAYRTSPAFKQDVGAVSAWLRRGEIESALIHCKPWDAALFKNRLTKIRRLTWIKNPNLFVPKLRKICAECGVAVVIARAPRGCRASGATQFINPRKALLLLSLRYLSDDHFWFTFFHEAGHLLLHGKQALYIEGADVDISKEEEEANIFAANTLIPSEFQPSFLDLIVDARAVLKFAKRIGISPGIVVGQLQNIGHAGPNKLNMLKRRYDWEKIDPERCFIRERK